MANEMRDAIKGNPIEDIRAVAVAGDAALAAAILGNTEPASTVTVADTANRYTGTNVETCLAEIAGAGRTTETVASVDTLIDGHIIATPGAHAASAISIPADTGAGAVYTAIEVDGALLEIAGATRSTETVKGNADAIANLAGGVSANATHTKGTLEVIAGLTAAELGDGAVHKTILTLAGVVMDVTDGDPANANGAWGTKKLYTFPQGHVQVLGAHFVSPIGGMVAASAGSGLTATADFEIGVGTVASGNEGVFGLNNGTQENIVAAITTALTASATTAIKSGVTTTPGNNYDGSTTAIPVNLNMRTSEDTDSGTDASTLTVTGTLTILWSVLGDN